MVASVLWEQIAALSLRERLDLVERIQATVPRVPTGVLPNDARELAQAITAAREDAAARPETLSSPEDLVEAIRSELRV